MESNLGAVWLCQRPPRHVCTSGVGGDHFVKPGGSVGGDHLVIPRGDSMDHSLRGMRGRSVMRRHLVTLLSLAAEGEEASCPGGCDQPQLRGGGPGMGSAGLAKSRGVGFQTVMEHRKVESRMLQLLSGLVEVPMCDQVGTPCPKHYRQLTELEKAPRTPGS